jgi:hypothetical protein
MTMNDLTAPLGQDPRRHRRAIAVPAEIIALALGLFFGAFVLWAVTAEDRSGGEPMAVAPADLRIAKKRGRRSSRYRKLPPQSIPPRPPQQQHCHHRLQQNRRAA